jgi:hypothetical protein
VIILTDDDDDDDDDGLGQELKEISTAPVSEPPAILTAFINNMKDIAGKYPNQQDPHQFRRNLSTLESRLHLNGVIHARQTTMEGLGSLSKLGIIMNTCFICVY